ncbi:6-phosphogluconolactonase [Pseudactinotalea suaedae]|uniref:6-phosphogluconolactonase n=1 Tax=Pseudactinotalea suaedae TaxID=1524924 RepID=UPI0012E1B1F1|nr:6-phosphogluconolactonase [Pseudactinotalea suaedae]
MTGNQPGRAGSADHADRADRAVVVHPDADAVARATAARLLLALMDAEAVRTPVHVCLTGGTVGTRTLAEVARSELRDLVDWTGVHLWWGDERFVPAGDDDRNEKQARTALIDALPIPAENVHPLPASDEAADLDAALTLARADLSSHAGDGGPWPVFDVMLLGVGPDGHVASLFPGKQSLQAMDVAAVGETDSPKPPPARVSLTLPVLNASRQVWFVVAGADKAEAVDAVLRGGSDLPAARVSGQDVTLWLLDAAAAGQPTG